MVDYLCANFDNFGLSRSGFIALNTLWIFLPCNLHLWPFDLIFIGARDIVVDYLCANFDDFGLRRSGFMV